MASPNKGHEWGAAKVNKLLGWAREFGVKSITFYALSLENMRKRPKAELNFIYRLIENEIDNYLKPDSMVFRDKIKVVFFGRLDLVPASLRAKAGEIMEATKGHKKGCANFALAYGGRQEIVNAAKRIADKVQAGLSPSKVTEKLFRQSLQTNGTGDPQLIIRTGGEKRISNFLVFQSAYSEFTFLDKMWPEITKRDFAKAVKDFAGRERRFGK